MRRTTHQSLAVGVALALTACGETEPESASAGGASTAAEPDQVTVGIIPILDVAPIYVGQEQGFFEERGIELTLQPAQGGAAIVPAVLNGETQFGFSNVVSLMIGHSQGLPLQIVTPANASTGVDGEDFQAIGVRSDSDIQTAADLEGRTVGVNTLNNICTVSINESVRQAGGDPTQLNYVEIPPPDLNAALDGGRIDAACMGEPFLSAHRAQGHRIIASNFVDMAPEALIGAYFTSDQLVESDPDLVERFTAAMEESLAYADENPDAVRAAAATYTALSEEQLAALTLPSFPTEINRESLETIAELAVDDGLFDEVPDLDALLP
jgi:NitT/TauT family transport system substrate-binding protein